MTAVVIPVVIGAVLIAGIIVGVVIWRKKVSQMNSNDEDPAKFPLKTPVKKVNFCHSRFVALLSLNPFTPEFLKQTLSPLNISDTSIVANRVSV